MNGLSFQSRPPNCCCSRPWGPFCCYNGVFGVWVDGIGDDLVAVAGSRPSIYMIERFGDNQTGPSSNVTAVSGQTALAVLKLQLQPGADTFTLYVNPIPGFPEPQAGTVKDDLDIGGVRGLGFAATGAFSLDEIRWGDTYADVAPGNPPSVVELVGEEGPWRFFRGTTEPSEFPGLAWARPEYDDTSWNTGLAGFGFGPDIASRQIATVLDDMEDNYGTLYLRRLFGVEDAGELSHLILRADSDDAFIAYINGIEVTRSGSMSTRLQAGTPVPFDASARVRSGSGPENYLVDMSSFPGLLHEGEQNVLAIQGINRRSADHDFILSQMELLGLGPVALPLLQAGDADQDLDFNQLDLVQVQIAAKYLTGQAATWGEGDWNGAPGGSPGNPHLGDGLFNQLDIVAAQQAGLYLRGAYAGGAEGELAAVPEPATNVLLAMALTAALLCGRSGRWC